MIVFPAIDLRGGKVVRLQQGRADAVTVYGDDPVAVARRWVAEGASWLHVVDLDGAFEGVPRNADCVQAILAAVSIPLQLGGGLRTREQIHAALAMGVRRCVIGTKACDAASELAGEFGERMAIGIDARDGFVAVKGWTEKTKLPAVEFARTLLEQGIQTVIFTDVSTDGMLTGPNVPAIERMCDAFAGQVIASGGVSCADDVRCLRGLARKHGNLSGVIVGKALYDGRIRLSEIV